MKRILALLAALMLLLTACRREFSTDAEMVRFRFSHHGMVSSSFYCYTAEQTETGWQMTVSLIGLDEEYALEMTQEDADRLDALVRRCGLWKWNGFDKNDRNVMDGEGFDLTIRYADGKQLEASGDNAFPDGYKAAENEINTYFKELLEQNGVMLTPERMG